MKILIISNLFPPNVYGGYEVGCADVARTLAERGHDITVLTSQGIRSTVSPKLKVKSLLRFWNTIDDGFLGNAPRETTAFKGRVIDVGNLSIIAQELSAERYDLVYCFNLLGVGAIAICDALQAGKVPWVWHLMDSIPLQMIGGVRPEILALFQVSSRREVNANRTLVMSRALQKEIERDVSLGSNTVILPGWAKVIEGAGDPPPRSRGFTRFAVIGALYAEKGVDLILKTLCQLAPSERLSMSVEFFGRGDVLRWRNEATKLGVDDCTKFHGLLPHDEVLKALGGFDALLFPTWEREPFGFVALEAAAYGLIPVITAGIGASEVLDDEVHAIHIKRDPTSLKNAILRICRNDDDLRQMAAQARQHVRTNYSLDRMVDLIEVELAKATTGGQWNPALFLRACEAAVFKERLASEFVVNAPGSVAITDDNRALIAMHVYGELKNVGRRASTNVLSNWLRSGAMKLLRPYFLEMMSDLLDIKSKQRDHDDDIRTMRLAIADLVARLEASERRRSSEERE